MEPYKYIIEHAPGAIAMFDHQMNCLVCSPQWLTDFGLTERTVTGSSLYEIFPEYCDKWKTIRQQCLAGTVNESDEVLCHRANGEMQYISRDIRSWHRQDGTAGGIIIYTTDITKQKTIEQQLSIEQDQFRGAFETAAIGMAIVGLDGRWLKVNDSILNILGYTKDELYELTFQDITHPDDLEADLELVAQLLEGKQDNYQMEKRYYHRNGQIIWAILSVSIVRDTIERPLHFISQITDITATKKIVHLRLAEADRHTSRIAIELHENIAQTLAAIKMYLNSSLSAKIYKDRDVEGVDKQLSSLITEVKSLTAKIIPTTFLQENLRTVIEDLALKYHVQYNLLINVDIDESLQKVSFNSSYHIFRIIEDHLKLAVLRNASMFRLSISNSKMIVIEIEADGQPSTLYASQEELLLGDIKTRIEMLDGILRNHIEENQNHQRLISIPAIKE